MTPRDGSSSDMYRFALDDADTAERLMTGSVDIADAPPRYRAVAGTLRALREAPDSWELAGERNAVEQIAAAVMLERSVRPIRPPRWRASRIAALAATAVAACALPLVGGLASAGALPEPAQNLTSTVLGKVGISVPTGAEAPPDNAPPASSVPGPPSPTGPSPGAGGSSPGAGGPAQDAEKRAPGSSSPTAPDEGKGHQHGAKSPGTPPDNNDSGANKDHGNTPARQNGRDGGNGSDHAR
jgi:hypothetical protein